MNKRIIGVSILIVVVGSLFSCSPSSDSKKEEDQGKAVLIFFQPDCDHCQREAEEIQQNLAAFRGSTLFFITSHPRQAIEKFANDYRLMGHPNVYFGWTSTF